MSTIVKHKFDAAQREIEQYNEDVERHNERIDDLDVFLSHNLGPETMAASFETILSERLAKISDTLSAKQKEYAQDDNRLHNFDVAARIGDTTPEKALKGMLLKHLVSVFDMIDDPEAVTVAMIDEKIGDTVNYLVLLEYMLLRRTENS